MMGEKETGVVVSRHGVEWLIAHGYFEACHHWNGLMSDKVFAAKLLDMERYVDSKMCPTSGDVLDSYVVVEQKEEARR